jgi:hypothetical protein
VTRPAVLKVGGGLEDNIPTPRLAGIIDEAECVLLRLGFCFVLQWLGRSDESLYLSRSE